MMEIISHTPTYVWFLLAYLLFSGWKARKTHVVSWGRLFIMPTVMFGWSLYSVFTRYDLSFICPWAGCIALGVWLGSLTVRNLNLRFDKQRKLIEIGGNWMPLILSIVVFALRYFLGATYGLYPELKGDLGLMIAESLATVASGMFSGRLVGYWRLSKTSILELPEYLGKVSKSSSEEELSK